MDALELGQKGLQKKTKNKQTEKAQNGGKNVSLNIDQNPCKV